MPPASSASPDSIDVVRLLSGLARRWRTLALVSVGMGGLTLAATLLIKPTYVSEAQIAILARGEANPYADPKTAPAGDQVAVRMDREAINSHAKALLAPELAQRIAGDMSLAEHPDFGNLRGGGSSEDKVLAELARRLVVVPSKDSRTILIRFSAMDRELAAEVANRLGEAYRERLAARALSESEDVQKGLVPRIDRLKQEATEAEAAVEQFRGAANLFRSSGQGSLNEQQLAALTAAETKARTEHDEAEARAKAARQLETGAEVHPDVQKSPLLQKLLGDRARIEGDIAKATAMLKDGHPAMKQLRSELASTERQIRLEVQRVTETLDKELAVAALRLDSARRSIAEVKSRVVGTGFDQARLSQLEANARAKRSELDRLQAQYESNRARADARVVPIEVQIVSRARPASQPSFPKPLPYAGLAMLAALLLTASLLIARDLVAGARPPRAAGIVEQKLSMPADGAPRMGHDRAEPAAAAKRTGKPDRQDRPGEVEDIVDLANRLISKRVERPGIRTLVAGASASVDPSAEAAELVRTVARAGGPVLLIDWSLDGAGVTRLLGLPLSPGLAELIDGNIGFVGAVGRVPNSTAQLIACGNGLVSAAGRGDVDRLNLLLDTLDEIYEQIVVVARFHAARDLFETIEGRFDVGVLIGGSTESPAVDADAPATFLGFEVDDLEVLRLARHLGSSRRRKDAWHVEAA
jgi:uncharacterized protein involved in exopolysaccharide biosynthesis